MRDAQPRRAWILCAQAQPVTYPAGPRGENGVRRLTYSLGPAAQPPFRVEIRCALCAVLHSC